MTIGDIEREVREFIRKRIEQNLESESDWITKRIHKNHQEIDGVDADWHRVIAYDRLRGLVREIVREFALKPKINPDPQLAFPGWEHLQKAYSVTRNDKQFIVPVDRLSKEEAKAKVIELRRMGEGCFKHAEELERYMRIRQDRA